MGQLHFEDLEPKRFEDLARQLIYDFKPWRRLEATGRAGADDGFDARGYEMVDGETPLLANEPEDEVPSDGARDRLWLVQCKRERSIGPTKLVGYLDDIRLSEDEKLHGIVFTAACDFSKTARDKFRQKCEALGIAEWHLWGKAELEDKLMRPENDGLLFAYFGISLTIRRRTQRAELRANLAVKRKVNRILEPRRHAEMLIRSPDAATYPDSDAVPEFKSKPPWIIGAYRGMEVNGIKFCIRRHFAYGVAKRATVDVAAAEVTKGGGGWRVPDAGEMMSLFEVACGNAKKKNASAPIFPEVIPMTFYLTSTAHGDSEHNTATQCLGSTGSLAGLGRKYVSVLRLVRDGSDGLTPSR